MGRPVLARSLLALLLAASAGAAVAPAARGGGGASPRLAVPAALTRSAPATQAGAALPPELRAGPLAGITVSLLAGAAVETTFSPTGNHLTLERWTLRPGERRAMDAVGPTLHYVADGSLVLEHDGVERTYAAGEQTLLDSPIASYALRNDTGACASVLRFWWVSTAGAGTSTDETGPNLDEPVACDEPYRTIFNTWVPLESPVAAEGVMPGPPGFAFIAEKTWETRRPDAFAPPATGLHAHTGPVAMAVERGTLVVSGRAEYRVELTPGGVVVFPPGSLHDETNLGEEPVTALLAGVIAPADAPPPAAAPGQALGLSADGLRYDSPWRDLSLAWDRSWAVLDRSSAVGQEGSPDPVDHVLLGNGTSVVEVWARAALHPTPQDCVAAFHPVAVPFPEPADLRPATDGQGQPIQGGDAASAYAVHVGTVDGLGEMAWFFRCSPLPTDPSVMVTVEWAVRSADFNAQSAVVEALLATMDGA